nr:MAG TPA: hypothetical protein [Caudoviricetes sp.]
MHKLYIFCSWIIHNIWYLKLHGYNTIKPSGHNQTGSNTTTDKITSYQTPLHSKHTTKSY